MRTKSCVVLQTALRLGGMRRIGGPNVMGQASLYDSDMEDRYAKLDLINTATRSQRFTHTSS